MSGKSYTVTEAQRALPELVERVKEGEALPIRQRVLGGMRGTAVMHDDLVAPLDGPWDASS